MTYPAVQVFLYFTLGRFSSFLSSSVGARLIIMHALHSVDVWFYIPSDLKIWRARMLSTMPLKHTGRNSKVRFSSFRIEHPGPPLEVVRFRGSDRLVDQNLPFHFDKPVHFPTSLHLICREFGKGIEYDNSHSSW